MVVRVRVRDVGRGAAAAVCCTVALALALAAMAALDDGAGGWAQTGGVALFAGAAVLSLTSCAAAALFAPSMRRAREPPRPALVDGKRLDALRSCPDAHALKAGGDGKAVCANELLVADGFDGADDAGAASGAGRNLVVKLFRGARTETELPARLEPIITVAPGTAASEALPANAFVGMKNQQVCDAMRGEHAQLIWPSLRAQCTLLAASAKGAFTPEAGVSTDFARTMTSMLLPAANATAATCAAKI